MEAARLMLCQARHTCYPARAYTAAETTRGPDTATHIEAYWNIRI